MKNIFAYILGFLMVSMLFAGTNVWAAQTELSGDDAIAAGIGPALNVQLSPNVTINYNGITTEFEMCGFNSSGTVEYGTASSKQGIYMHAATGDPLAISNINTTDGSTVSGTGWTLMGSAGGS